MYIEMTEQMYGIVSTFTFVSYCIFLSLLYIENIVW